MPIRRSTCRRVPVGDAYRPGVQRGRTTTEAGRIKDIGGTPRGCNYPRSPATNRRHTRRIRASAIANRAGDRAMESGCDGMKVPAGNFACWAPFNLTPIFRACVMQETECDGNDTASGSRAGLPAGFRLPAFSEPRMRPGAPARYGSVHTFRAPPRAALVSTAYRWAEVPPVRLKTRTNLESLLRAGILSNLEDVSPSRAGEQPGLEVSATRR